MKVKSSDGMENGTLDIGVPYRSDSNRLLFLASTRQIIS
jgi:hypothetical protein